ncbi:hypothetical protein [Croceicoccus gelatinilyticus]|uniref:hypothetical protein n=1 Tax=Croceicoccus gelatinilyticus TaxID=2835536 RepID=UPI001BCE24F4|nr:hypothetical protein [Croceicoccus gelatinilyticus]MBS7671422.1 hypothetical protein [Croceicoccus gelatinilyticus]
MFREISDKAYGEAAETVEAARLAHLPRDVLPEDALIVAGAALALEQGSPNEFALSYETEAMRYLHIGNREANLMQSAVAHYLDEKKQRGGPFDTTREAMSFIVNDVMIQSAAIRVDRALDNPDLIAQLRGPAEKQLYEEASRDSGMQETMSKISTGGFYRIPEEERAAFEALVSGPIPQKKLREAVVEQAGYVDDAIARADRSVKELGKAEPWARRFIEVEQSNQLKAWHHLTKTEELTPAEGGALIDDFMKVRGPMGPANLLDAQTCGRFLQEREQMQMADASWLVRMSADWRHMFEATNRLSTANYQDCDTYRTDEEVASGQYHKLDEAPEAFIAFDLAAGHGVPPLERLKIERMTGFAECEFEIEKTRTQEPARKPLLAADLYAAGLAQSQMGM